MFKRPGEKSYRFFFASLQVQNYKESPKTLRILNILAKIGINYPNPTGTTCAIGAPYYVPVNVPLCTC